MADPVKDWTTDYDIFSTEYVKNPFPIWDEIREKCPVAHTDRWGGSFMPTRYEDLFNIAKDITDFSSRNVLVADVMPAPGEELEVEPEMVENYNVGGGMIAKLKKGASFTLDQERVNDEIWLPSTADINMSVRVFLVKGIDLNAVIKSYDYRKFTTEVKDAKVNSSEQP